MSLEHQRYEQLQSSTPAKEDTTTQGLFDSWKEKLNYILGDGDLAEQEQKQLDAQEQSLNDQRDREQAQLAQEFKDRELRPHQQSIMDQFEWGEREQAQQAVSDPFGYAQAYQQSWNERYGVFS